jgi:hypothetical protein
VSSPHLLPLTAFLSSAFTTLFLLLSRAYYIGANPLDIQTELLLHGPVEASFTVYADFLAYAALPPPPPLKHAH